MSLNPSIIKMLDLYRGVPLSEEQKMREILQQFALLGLVRQNFFEHAAFYGGTALRILHGLNRFSEDLVFSLLVPNPNFNIVPYLEGLRAEINAFGFDVDVSVKEKNHQTAILSAFLKTNTMNLLLSVQGHYKKRDLHPESKIRIKMEVDTDPPLGFTLDTHVVLNPIPFNVVTFDKSDLFAGKLHAALCRGWKQRVKGRDWYDLIWFLGHRVPLNLKHLSQRMQQLGNLEQGIELTPNSLRVLLENKIDQVDWKAAKEDVAAFITDQAQLELWSPDFFKQITTRMIFKE